MNRNPILQQLVNDPDWPMAAELSELARSFLPGNLPAAGPSAHQHRLDGELQDYLDFCRFRAKEKLRGSVSERHAAWEAACLAEACSLMQRQILRGGGYAPPRMFSEPFRVC